MTIQTHAEDRRTLVQKISEHLQAESRYQGPPTFSYTVGPITVARDGSLACEDAQALEALKPFLTEHGFIEPEVVTLESITPAEPEIEDLEDTNPIEPEVDDLEGMRPIEPEDDVMAISLPTEGMDGNQLRNLMYLLYNYQHLLNRVTRRESFSISEAVTTRLGEYVPETLSDFETLMDDFIAMDDLTGVDFRDGTVTLIFPLDASPEKNRAYSDLASAVLRAAKEAKRVGLELRRPENEKYVLRSWLLRMGFGGADYKASRNALLIGLKGHTAFRNDDEAMKHKNKYAEIRKIARELREGEAQ